MVCADISRNEKSLNRSVYFNKCTDILSDKKLYFKHRAEPCENLYFKNGPWLKPTVQNAKRATLKADIIDRGNDGKYNFARVLIKNISDTPAYPVTVDSANDKQRCFLNENFFMLKPHEEKIICITCDSGEIEKIQIDIWNGETITV